MKLVAAEQMRSLDRAAIGEGGIPSLDLMEMAGSSVADAVVRIMPSSDGGRIFVVAGKGNNGGDGLVAARNLALRGYDVDVAILADSNSLSVDARANFERLSETNVRVVFIDDESKLHDVVSKSSDVKIIIDAILGTGIKNDVRGLSASAIDIINAGSKRVVSADMPSGISSDTGMAMGRAVKATVTVTFGLPKIGLFVGDGPAHAGRIIVADIGIPKEYVNAVDAKYEMIDDIMVKRHFRPRRADGHKGNYGHVVVFAGSRGHLGAGYLACMASLKFGSGLATYCLPKSTFAKFDTRYPEIMCDAIEDSESGEFVSSSLEEALAILNKKSAAVIGPAIGTSDETRRFLNGFVERASIPLVIDADGLNLLNISSFNTYGKVRILTPHPGEMSRLMEKSTREIQSSRFESANKLARDTGAIVVLKGRGTVVASPDGRLAVNPTGNAGMATAGMGDALSGMIASLLGQGITAFEAACAAVYVHGLAGDVAADKIGERPLITSDVITCMSDVVLMLESSA